MAFTARPGVTIVLGHSGAGKTTLLRSIAGLCDPDKGRITIAGTVLFDSDMKIGVQPARRKMAFVFQDLALFPHLSVYANVCYGLRHLTATERNRRADEVLASFQIANLRKRLPREISGGEQQRVALARSLVTEPAVLLLDEPLSSLDVNTKASIIQDLRAWNQARMIPMVYVTHNHDEVFALGEHVISLERGRIVAQGKPADVVSASHHPAVVHIAAFENLFDVPVIRVRNKEGSVTCRLGEASIEIRSPGARVMPGDIVQIGIRSNEILLASARPEMLDDCNLIRGRIGQIERNDSGTDVLIECGVEFRAHPGFGLKDRELKPGSDIWMIIRPGSCHLIRTARLRLAQRLFVFICNGNIRRSPVAEAICNAEIARRLNLPGEKSGLIGVHAVSAGLSALPDEPMAIEAQRALQHLNVPVPRHRSKNLTGELAVEAELIFCMTESQRRTVIGMFPNLAPRVLCLPHSDLEDAQDHGPHDFMHLAQRIQESIHTLMDTILCPADSPELRQGTHS